MRESRLLKYINLYSQNQAIGLFGVDEAGSITVWDNKMSAMTGLDHMKAIGSSLVKNEKNNHEVFGFRARTNFAFELDQLKNNNKNNPGKHINLEFEWPLNNVRGDALLLNVNLLGIIVGRKYPAQFLFIASKISSPVNGISNYDSPFALLTRSIDLARLYRSGGDSEVFFNKMLDDLLLFSQSEYGFIAEVRFDLNNSPYLASRAITNISWNTETLEFYKQRPMVFRNLDTLFGACLKTGELVIANEPATDSRRGGMPAAHPPLDKFIGIPLKHQGKLVGMIGLANRKTGYEETIIDFLEPILGVSTDVFRDISMGRKLKYLEDTNLALFNKTRSMNFITRRNANSLSGIIIEANESFIDLLMYESYKVLGSPTLNFFTTDSHKKLEDIEKKLGSYINESNQTISTNSDIKYTTLVELVDGNQHLVPAEVTVSFATNQNAEVTGLNVTCRDMSEEISAKYYRAQLETEWLSLINSAKVGVLSIGPDYSVTEWNQNMVAITGIDDSVILGKNYFDFINTDISSEHRSNLTNLLNGTENNCSFEVVFKTGTSQMVKMLISAVSKHDKDVDIRGIRALGQDITLLSEQAITIMQTQKMEALGLMAGGLAHDLNNILAIVKGNLELIWQEVAENIELRDMVDDALSSANDGYDITRRLMAFSRTQPIHKRDIPVNSVISGCMKILNRSLGKKISLEYKEDKSDPIIKIDANQLENAMLNLVLNSRDAIDGAVDGKIIIMVEHINIDSFGSAHLEYLYPGNYVTISVSDNGSGMSPAVRIQALDPYFTTKPVGTGTGFGLSMVHGFTRQNGGGMNIKSVQGLGTTVKLYLPMTKVSRLSPSDVSIIEDGNKGSKIINNGTIINNILIVDDNEKVLRVVRKSLNEWGFNTYSAENADQALRLLSRTPEIELVLSDIVMHGSLSGRELAKEISKLYPHMKVILMTGYEPNSVNMNNTDTFVLYKPYNKEQFFNALKECVQKKH